MERTVGRQGALQVSMLVEIRDALAALLDGAHAADAAALRRALHRLWGAFDSLTNEAKLFLGDLDRHVARRVVRMGRPRAGARGGGVTAEHALALLGGKPYERLFAAVRARLEAAGAGARSVTVRGLDDDERTALADLLGWSSIPEGDVRVHLGALDSALRASRASASLAEVLDARRSAARPPRRASSGARREGGRVD